MGAEEGGRGERKCWLLCGKAGNAGQDLELAPVPRGSQEAAGGQDTCHLPGA